MGPETQAFEMATAAERVEQAVQKLQAAMPN